jgi:dihydrodipicolinate synthase/N-acetylneuraminate lyase
MLRYFEAISDAIEIGIMIYNNPWYPPPTAR